MNGTIVIRDIFGVVYVLEDEPHEKFMSLRHELVEPGTILIVAPDKHVALNPRHVVSVEWKFS